MSLNNIKRKNKILGVILNGKYIDLEATLMNWSTNDSKKALVALRNDEVDNDIRDINLLCCPYCEKPVKLRYQKSTDYPYFKHKYENDSKNCFFEDNDLETKRQEIVRARKYEGRSTGRLHIEAVQGIANILSISDDCHLLTKPDSKRLYHQSGSGEYRIPDVYFSFKSKKIVIEVQNSPEWIKVIAEREKFYSENDIHLIWVFTTNRLIKNSVTSLDIAYRHGFNSFLFNNDVYDAGIAEKKLFLQCDYENIIPQFVDNKYKPQTVPQTELISLEQLHYSKDGLPYFLKHHSSQGDVEEFCNSRNRIEDEISRKHLPEMDADYYRYMLEAGYFSKYHSFPSYVKQKEIERLNHLASCYISALYLYGSLRKNNQLEFAYSFDKSGKFQKKINTAKEFWEAVKNNHVKAKQMFDNNKRMSHTTVKGWRRTIDSKYNKFDELFPYLTVLNQKANILIELICKNLINSEDFVEKYRRTN